MLVTDFIVMGLNPELGIPLHFFKNMMDLGRVKQPFKIGAATAAHAFLGLAFISTHNIVLGKGKRRYGLRFGHVFYLVQ
jgi:hypothetical protein